MTGPGHGEEACLAGDPGNDFYLGDGTVCGPASTCPASAGSCSPDADGDGIQTDVDPNDSYPLNTTFVDTSTSPATTGNYAEQGDQDLCASDEPLPKGVRVESLSGGAAPAKVQLTCWGSGTRDMDTGDLTSGDCLIFTCESGPNARVEWCPGTTADAGTAAAGLPVREVQVDLLRSGLVVASLVLPEGNSIIYDPQTAEATAPASNNTTLILAGRSGGQQALPAGGTTTVPDSAIPTASSWGLAVLALALLVGARVYFTRRRAAQA